MPLAEQSAEQAESARASIRAIIEMEKQLLHELQIKQSQATGPVDHQLKATIHLMYKTIKDDHKRFAKIGTKSRESPNYIQILLGVVIVALLSVVIFMLSND